MTKKIKFTSLFIAIMLIFAFALGCVKVNTLYANSGINIDLEKQELDQIFTFEEYQDSYYISGYKGNLSYLEIPEYYNGKKVTGIKDNVAYDSLGNPYSVKGVFEDKTFVKINFGSNLTYIGSGAFKGCANLLEISIPENVKRIHHNAFYNCTSLNTIELPYLEYLGNEVFYGTAWQNAIMQANVDKHMMDIGGELDQEEDYHFNNEVYYENGDNIMLIKVYNLLNRESYIVKEGTRLLASQAFSYKLPIKSITLPTTVGFIGSALLGPPPYNIYNGEVVIDGIGCQINVTHQGALLNAEQKRAYFEGVKLEEFTFANVSVPAVLGTYTTGSSSGTEIYIVPNTIVNITKRAFLKQFAIKELTIPNSVKYIGVEAFKGCKYIEKITFENGGQVYIEEGAFEGCTNLTTIVGAENIAQIGANAFKGCTKLDGVVLGNVNVLPNAFYGCSSLETISQKVGTTIKSIGYNAFYGTKVIDKKDSNNFAMVGDYIIKYYGDSTSLTIENNVADFAFDSSLKLQSVILGENILLGKGAFARCINLQSITLNNNSVSNFCFFNSEKLVEVIGQPTSVGDFAFANTKLNSLDLSKATSIGCYALYNTALSTLDIYNAELKDYALFGLQGLSAISATNSENYIVSDGVLYNKDKTILVCYPASLNKANIVLNNVIIGKGAFNNSKNAVEITGTVTEVLDKAFYNAQVKYSVENTQKVGYKAFYQSKVETLNLQNVELQEKALCYCANLTTLNLSSTKEIPLGALKGTSGLKNLTIKLNDNYLDYRSQLGYIFGMDYYLGGEKTYQNFNKSYKKTYYVPKIENLTISGGKVLVGSLMDLKTLKTANLSNATDISIYALAGCTSLENVLLGSNLKNIPSYTFNGCNSLKGLNSIDTINLEGITLIGENAFGGCVSISQVDILEGLKASDINSGAFVNCSNLKTVNIYSQEFFDLNNNITIYGNLFDNAINVNVGGVALTIEEIIDLRNFSFEQKNKGFITIIKENKIVIICCGFIVLAVLIAIIMPIVRRKINLKSVDEFGRPVKTHKTKHHHKHHHHHEHKHH